MLPECIPQTGQVLPNYPDRRLRRIRIISIIIQKMTEYSIYYKQVVSPCQEKNVKIRCIFQIEYLQIPLHIVTAR